MSNVICLDTARALRIANEIAGCGSLQSAIAVAWNTPNAGDLLSDLLAEQAARAELNPAVKFRALLRQARDLEARAEPLMAEGAEFAGKAAMRRLRGDRDLADSFARRAEACEGRARELMDEAFRLKFQAAEIKASMDGLDGLIDAVSSISEMA